MEQPPRGTQTAWDLGLCPRTREKCWAAGSREEAIPGSERGAPRIIAPALDLMHSPIELWARTGLVTLK